ncbi:phosphoglycerate kinase [Candidatus Saccharibacteria bacterium]|nr:phosphoglycerate kinase [Candidatus Saccharibacteria bacterium]
MFQQKTIRDVDVKDKIVLVRTDYNVPLENSQIVDDLRIRASLPTLEYLLTNGVKNVVIISHLGRPHGPEADLSLAPIAARLKELLPNTPVSFCNQVSGSEVTNAIDKSPKGGIIILENLRFWPGEKENDKSFAKQIVDSTHAELFVQDGFAVIHRAHASTSAITELLPSVAGLLLEKEITTLSQVTHNPPHPFAVIIGGAKVADKQPLIEKLLPIADTLLVGGKIAADGYTSSDPKIYVAEDFSSPEKEDLGPIATEKILQSITSASTVLWNGTLGKVEDPAYQDSSTKIATAIGTHPTNNYTSIICGGDTTAFVESLQKSDPNLNYTLISTGGGAALALLAGEPLPGLTGLSKK